MSLEYASQRSYLDDLFSVYPTIPNGIREINKSIWEKVESAYNAKDSFALVNAMLELDLFPIKDSYVAYMKRDKSSVKRNPRTVNRIANQIMQMDLGVYEMLTAERKKPTGWSDVQEMGGNRGSWLSFERSRCICKQQ